MELTRINFSPFQHDQQQQQEQQQQQQQQQTSLIQFNSNPKNLHDCLENQEPSTSESITSTTPAMVFDNIIDDDNSKHFENGYQRQPKRQDEIHGIDQERIVRFVYLGQALLIIIVALACIAFTILEPKMVIENVTNTGMH